MGIRPLLEHVIYRIQGTGPIRPVELRLIGEGVTSDDIRLMVNTRTRVDVGSWIGKQRVRACVMADDLCLVANGKRPYLERIPLSALDKSLYNHVTGEVLLAPVEESQVQALRMSPTDGTALLDCIHRS